MTELQLHVHILRLHTLYISQSTYINRTGYGPEDFDFSSSLDDTSDSDSDNSLWFNISPRKRNTVHQNQVAMKVM